jgi:hypothetical protein
MEENRVRQIIEELKEYKKEQRIGKKYHAWKTKLYTGHISNEYLGVVEYVGTRDNLINPFIVKTENNKEVYAGTIDFFSHVNAKPFSWLK